MLAAGGPSLEVGLREGWGSVALLPIPGLLKRLSENFDRWPPGWNWSPGSFFQPSSLRRQVGGPSDLKPNLFSVICLGGEFRELGGKEASAIKAPDRHRDCPPTPGHAGQVPICFRHWRPGEGCVQASRGRGERTGRVLRGCRCG